MKRAIWAVVASALVLAVAGRTWADEKTAPAKEAGPAVKADEGQKPAEAKPEAAATEQPVKGKGKGGRGMGALPAGYGQLDLSAEQREKIMAIHTETSKELKALKEKEEQLRADEDKQLEALLTAEQKAKLDEFKKTHAEKAKVKKNVKKGAEGEKAPEKGAEKAPEAGAK